MTIFNKSASPTPNEIEEASRKEARAVAFPPDRLLCRVLGMFKMFAPSSDVSLTPHLAMDGYWESWITAAFCRLVWPDMHVVNVGANIGYYSLLAAHLVGKHGRVDAFEPNPALVGVLRDNASVNGFREILRVDPRAVADKPGEMLLRYPRNNPMMGSVLKRNVEWVESAAFVDFWDVASVGVTTLDDAVDHRPDLVFVDAEGAEPLVIAGMLGHIGKSPLGPTLVLEWSPRRYDDPKGAAKAITSLGYKVCEIREDGTGRSLGADEFAAIEEETTVVCRRDAR